MPKPSAQSFVRWSIAVAVAGLALATVSACDAPSPTPAPGANPRQVTVLGSGQVQGVPDTLTADVGIEFTAPDVTTAMNQTNDRQLAVINTLVGMNGQFRDLGNTVQDNLFAGVADDIKNLITSGLPVLRHGLGDIATAWNGTIKQLTSSLGSDSSKGLLDRILGDTAKAQTEFTKAIDPLVHGIGVLTAAGADALPRLADDLGAIANRFNAFITAADQDGRLTTWISDGITGFEKLGNSIINIGTAISGITKAAGGVPGASS